MRYLLDLTPLNKDQQFEWDYASPEDYRTPVITYDENKREEIIVQFKEGIDFEAWLELYTYFGIRFENRLHSDQQHYLLSFHPDIMSFKRLEASIKEDGGVNYVKKKKKKKRKSKSKHR